MKNILQKITGTLCLFIIPALFSTALACTGWAAYSSYTFGTWGDNYYTVGGTTVGAGEMKSDTNFSWSFYAKSYSMDCRSSANYAINRGISKWPDSRNKITNYFREQQSSCTDHFQRIYDQYAHSFCKN